MRWARIENQNEIEIHTRTHERVHEMMMQPIQLCLRLKYARWKLYVCVLYRTYQGENNFLLQDALEIGNFGLDCNCNQQPKTLTLYEMRWQMLALLLLLALYFYIQQTLTNRECPSDSAAMHYLHSCKNSLIKIKWVPTMHKKEECIAANSDGNLRKITNPNR